MVGYVILRRLARPCEKVALDESIFGEIPVSLPEHALWLAVIERAMMDYLGRCASLARPSKHSMQDFFFDLEPRPNNLQYICEILFDFPDAANMIRKRLHELSTLPDDQPVRSPGTLRYVSKLKKKKPTSSSSSQ